MGIDLGTSGVKVVVIDQNGQVVGTGRRINPNFLGPSGYNIQTSGGYHLFCHKSCLGGRRGH